MIAPRRALDVFPYDPARLARHGFTEADNDLAQTLRDASSATKMVRGNVVPDHTIRLLANDQKAKLLGAYPSRSAPTVNAKQAVIVVQPGWMPK